MTLDKTLPVLLAQRKMKQSDLARMTGISTGLSSWTVTDPLRRTEKWPLPGAFPGRGPALLSAVRDDHYRLGQTRHVSLVERTEPVHRLDVAGYLLGAPAHPLALAFFHGATTSRARVYIGAGAAL